VEVPIFSSTTRSTTELKGLTAPILTGTPLMMEQLDYLGEVDFVVVDMRIVMSCS
jgi:hypothetical protein